MTDDLCRSGFLDGKGEADLPGLGVRTELIEVLDGFSFECLIRTWIPGNFDGLLDLSGASAIDPVNETL